MGVETPIPPIAMNARRSRRTRVSSSFPPGSDEPVGPRGGDQYGGI
jgi:hypothetical protein